MESVIIYGLGSFCRNFFTGSPEITETVSFFCDKDPAAANGNSFCGRPFFPAEELAGRRHGEKVVIGTPYYAYDVRRYLKGHLLVENKDILELSEWVDMTFGQRFERIRERLTDPESEDFFHARKKIAVDGDLSAFVAVNRAYSEGRRFSSYFLNKLMQKNRSARVVLITEEYCSDANRSILELCGKTVAGLYCADTGRGDICLEELASEKYQDCTYVITGAPVCRAAGEELGKAGIPDERLFFLNGSPLCSGCRKGQYFDLWNPEENEVFVDCGAYIGEEENSFIDWTGGRFEHIYAFEPLHEMAGPIRKKYSGDERISVTEAAVWSNTGELSFVTQEELSGSGVKGELSREYNGGFTVPAVALDDVISGRVTFIKMDIEGSELEALKGARRIISGQKPRLAISIYHKPMDFLLIPEYILSLVPEYKMAIRHYGADALETVLYAWV